MEIKQFVWDVVDSNSWLIVEDNAGLLIDAIDSDALLDTVCGLDQLTIFLTHSHFDHISGLNRIREARPDACVISTKLCSEYLGNIYKNMSSSATAFMVFYNGCHDVRIDPITCAPANIVFERDMDYCWQKHDIKMTAVHGHSADGMVLVFDKKILFSGDTLLAIPTVTRFPSGSTARFWEEDIPGLRSMDVDIVYPGHGNPGKLEDMLSANVKPERFRKKDS